jgi:hypothetical protein
MVQVRQGKLNFTAMSDIPEGASVLTGHSLSTALLLRFYLIHELPIVSLVKNY